MERIKRSEKNRVIECFENLGRKVFYEWGSTEIRCHRRIMKIGFTKNKAIGLMLGGRSSLVTFRCAISVAEKDRNLIYRD